MHVLVPGRRAMPRHVLRAGIVVLGANGERIGAVEDLSLRGMQFASSLPLPVRHTMDLHLDVSELRGLREDPIRVRGAVRWRVRGPLAWRVGMEFVDVGLAERIDLGLVVRFVGNHAEADPGT